MRDARQENREYQQQLEKWLEMALVELGNRKEFLKLTSFFNFTDEDKAPEMSAYTLSRTTGSGAEIPTRKEGKHNLYIVFGVLYALGIVDKSTIEIFMQTYRITPPKGDEWQDVWSRIDSETI